MMAKLTYSVLPLLLISSLVQSQQITQSDFRSAKSAMTQTNWQEVSLSPSNYESLLSGFATKEQQIIARAQLIRALSTGQLSEEQKQWLENQSNSDLVLTTTDTDHPEKLIQLVNIKHMANTAINTWKSSNLAAHFTQKLVTNDWQWQLLENTSDRKTVSAFEKAFSNLAQQNKRSVISDYLENKEDISVANEYKYSMFKSSLDTRLLPELWVDIDQFSYQTLQVLPNSGLSEESTIRLIEQAANNPMLTSQALLLLANNYANNEHTHKIMLKFLQQPSHQWSAAIVASKINNAKFQSSLNELAATAPNKAIAYTLKQTNALQE